MSVLSLNSCDDAVDRNEVAREPEILRGNSHRESEQLRQMENGQVEGGFDGLSGPFLVNIQTHMAEGTRRHHEVGAVIPGVFHVGPGHGDRDGLLFEDDRKSATFRPARIGDRFPADVGPCALLADFLAALLPA